MSPPNTDPRPKENIDENANKDIGNPRLGVCQQGDYVTASIPPYSCGCHISAMLPPTKDAPVEPKTPCSIREPITTCMLGALLVMSARLLQQLHDNLQCIHNFSEHK
jgi:hypothetical protein